MIVPDLVAAKHRRLNAASVASHFDSTASNCQPMNFAPLLPSMMTSTMSLMMLKNFESNWILQ